MLTAIIYFFIWKIQCYIILYPTIKNEIGSGFLLFRGVSLQENCLISSIEGSTREFGSGFAWKDLCGDKPARPR